MSIIHGLRLCREMRAKSAVASLIFCPGSALVVLNETTAGKKDLVFFHVPMNFGNSVALAAGVGTGSNLTYGQVSGAARRGWGEVNKLLKPGGSVWGPLHPDLQEDSELGIPMYYTPVEHWPPILAEQYFGNKKVFGILRDPFERLVALFRGMNGHSVARGSHFDNDGRTCRKQLNDWVRRIRDQMMENPEQVDSDVRANLMEQAQYFEGPHAITLALDLTTFPSSANKILQEHGYDINIEADDCMHVTGCDNTWAADLDEDVKQFVRETYSRDFELRCNLFGHCDMEPQCVPEIPGMCPDKAFEWNVQARRYVPRK